MRKWWQWNIRWWLKRHSLFEYFVVWHAKLHHLLPNDNRAFEKGQEFVEMEIAQNHVNTKIKMDFAHAKDAIYGNVRTEKALLQGKINALTSEINKYNADLDDQNDKGIVGKLHKDATTADTTAQDYGSLFFPEKQLQAYLDKDHEQYLEGLSAIMGAADSDAVVLEHGVKKKLVYTYIDKWSRNFIELRDRLLEMVDSKRFPLSQAVYRGTFAICFLFMFCEMFISRKVLLGKANALISITPWSAVNNIIYEVILLSYAAGISLFLAALYYMVFSLKGFWKRFGFAALLFCIIATFMSFFFSQNHLKEYPGRNFNPTGIMFGLLSAGFALANAWYYRQAVYQKNLYKKSFPGRSAKYSRRRIDTWTRRRGRQLRSNTNKLVRLEGLLAAFEVVNEEAVEKYMINLEVAYVAEFWNGFHTNLNGIIENNREINIAIIKQVKTKLHHEKHHQKLNNRHNGVSQPVMST